MAARGAPEQAYVWVWLPRRVEPVVAGVVGRVGSRLAFRYAASYLERFDSVPLYLPELPLQRAQIVPDKAVAGCLRDAGPDGWGQQLIIARMAEGLTRYDELGEPGLLNFLLESGSDRIGALDFQDSPYEYIPRGGSATLEEMTEAAVRYEAGEPLSAALEVALLHGTSVGGARPKVLLEQAGHPGWVAKLSLARDPYPVVKAEAVAMNLARRAGLAAADSRVTSCLGRDVLLVERFDRSGTAGERKMMVSALTVLGLDETAGRYATYHELADTIRARFTDPDATLRELFSRIVFNICVSNTDDHARNHAAFWDGPAGMLTLTPAYDICPQLRSGDTAYQAMAISRDGRRESRFALCREVSALYHLKPSEADAIIDRQVETITAQWPDAADECRLTAREREQMWGRQILNPAARYKD